VFLVVENTAATRAACALQSFNHALSAAHIFL
jgi:hypothetical protein